MCTECSFTQWRPCAFGLAADAAFQESRHEEKRKAGRTTRGSRQQLYCIPALHTTRAPRLVPSCNAVSRTMGTIPRCDTLTRQTNKTVPKLMSFLVSPHGALISLGNIVQQDNPAFRLVHVGVILALEPPLVLCGRSCLGVLGGLLTLL